VVLLAVLGQGCDEKACLMSADHPDRSQTTTFKWPKFEPCSKCGGGGMHYNGEDIMCCQACGGGGSVVARDERGRFLPWEVVNHVEQ
jgi:DnaJ-class molecular chaperone